MALTLKVGTVEQGSAYCTRERDAAPFRPASVAELHPGKPARVAQLCALEALADRQSIRAEQLRAGREIRDYWRVWTLAFNARIASYGAARFGEQAEVIPPSLRSLVGRYRDWAQAADAAKVPPPAPVPAVPPAEAVAAALAQEQRDLLRDVVTELKRMNLGFA